MQIDPLYWSPVRMNFSAFKLIAWVLLRNRARVVPRTDVDRVVANLQPGQNGVEAFTLAIAHTTLSFVAMYALMERYVRARPLIFALLLPIILFAALVVTQTAVFLICYGVSRMRRAMRQPDSKRWNSLAVTVVTVGVAIWLISRGGWSVWPGTVWLALLALNLVAAAIVRLMREQLRVMEEQIERGASSAV